MIPESDSEFTLARASLTTVTHSLTLALCQGQPLCTLTLPCNILPAAGQPSQSICSARASPGTDCKQLIKRLSPTQSAVSLCGTTITHRGGHKSPDLVECRCYFASRPGVDAFGHGYILHCESSQAVPKGAHSSEGLSPGRPV